MIEHSELKKLLDYDPETGVFVWKVRRNSYGGIVKPGSEAGALDGKGYLVIGVNGKRYLAHRLAWFFVFGVWPSDEIDHINRERLDNRIENLRVVSSSENKYNKAKPGKNNSGHTGVCFNVFHRKYEAHIKRNGRRYSGGLHTLLEDAVLARKKLETSIWPEYSA